MSRNFFNVWTISISRNPYLKETTVCKAGCKRKTNFLTKQCSYHGGRGEYYTKWFRSFKFPWQRYSRLEIVFHEPLTEEIKNAYKN